MAVVLVVCRPAEAGARDDTADMIRHGFGLIGAFGGALALAVAVLAGYGTGPDGLGLGVRFTARWSFLFFWLSYAGGAMAILFGPAFAGLARRREPWAWPSPPRFRSISDWSSGWASSSARFRYRAACCCSFWSRCSSAICWCCCPSESEYAPGTSVAATALPGHDLHSDRLRPGFCAGRTRPETQHWLFAVEYLPFALLCLIAIPLRLAAFLRQRLGLRSATVHAPRQTVS